MLVQVEAQHIFAFNVQLDIEPGAWEVSAEKAVAPLGHAGAAGKQLCTGADGKPEGCHTRQVHHVARCHIVCPMLGAMLDPASTPPSKLDGTLLLCWDGTLLLCWDGTLLLCPQAQRHAVLEELALQCKV